MGFNTSAIIAEIFYFPDRALHLHENNIENGGFDMQRKFQGTNTRSGRPKPVTSRYPGTPGKAVW
jgi:hypothetical protein